MGLRAAAFFLSVTVMTGCGDGSSGGGKEAGPAYTELALFGHTLRLEKGSGLREGCFVFDMYWITKSQKTCKLAVTDGGKADGTQDWATSDGSFKITTKDAKGDEISDKAWEIDGAIYHCRTSSAALYDSKGALVTSETKLMLLGKDWESVDEILPSETDGVAAITFAREPDCQAFVGS